MKNKNSVLIKTKRRLEYAQRRMLGKVRNTIWLNSIIIVIVIVFGGYFAMKNHVENQFDKKFMTSKIRLNNSIEVHSKINTFNLIANQSRFSYQVDLQKLKIWLDQKSKENRLFITNESESIYNVEDFFNIDNGDVDKFEKNLFEINRLYNAMDSMTQDELKNKFWVTLATYPQKIALEQAMYNIIFEYEGHRKDFDDEYFNKLDNYYRNALSELEKHESIMGVKIWKADTTLYGENGVFYFHPDMHSKIVTSTD